MTSPTVSVIVPAHNVETYIGQCLDSLITQDTHEIEIIVVDDGSTDDTGKIASVYAASNPQIVLLTQPNRGLSEARNRGLEVVRGQYVGFVDGDDWVHASMFREMYHLATKTGSDFVITNGRLYNHLTKSLQPFQDRRLWNQLWQSGLSDAFNPRLKQELFRLDTSTCKRLYRREFLERLRFRFHANLIFEDVPAHYRLMLSADRVALLPRLHYFYRSHRPGRITSYADEKLFDVFAVMELVMRDLVALAADDMIWANFIWHQSWVLRWLRRQIRKDLSVSFDGKATAIALTFPQGGLETFFAQFAADEKATAFVSAQTSGHLQRE